MRIRRARTYRLYRQTKTKAINITTSLVMVASSLGGTLPVLLTGKVFAAANITVCSTAAPTCDYTDIQAAVDAAQPGDTIDIQPGTIALSSPVTVDKAVTIRGEAGTIVTADNTSYAFVITGAGASITNLSVARFSKGSNTALVGVQAADVTISNSVFNGNWSFVDTGDTTRAFELSGTAQNVLITGNYINTLRGAAYINNGASGTVSNNYTEGTKGWVAEGGSNIVFSGNTWGTSVNADGNERNAVDIAIIPGSPDATTDNYSDVMGLSQANHTAVIDNQLLGAPSVPHTLSDAYVSSAAAAGGNGYWQSPFQTIQAGVTAVATGGRIHVAAGAYDPATISKTVTLLGAQAGVSAVSGRTHGSANESLLVGSTSYSPSLNVTADNVTLDGFDFGPASGGASSGPVGVDLGNSSGATVTDSIFEHNQRGISLNGANNVTISNDLIAYNNADPENNAGVWGDNVNGITVENSRLDGPSNTAINLATGSKDIHITDNTADGGGNLAVLWDDSNATVSGNTVTNMTGSKVFITGSQNVSVSGNTLHGTGTGVYVANYAGNSSSLSVVNNDLSGLGNGIYLDDNIVSDTLTATGNNFANDSTAGVNTNNNTSRVLVNASGSWWGNASGPTDAVSGDGSVLDKNANGTGSAALGAVGYSPWCTTADCAADSSVAPGTPTNLTARFQYDSSDVANGATLNKTSKSGGNNLELEWTAGSGWVNGYHIITTYPDGTQNTGYQGPNTNAWLVPNGFGQHGQGKYTFQVVAVNNNGESQPSATFTIYYDTQSPSAQFTQAPAEGSYLKGTFSVTATASDNVALSSVGFDVRDPHDTTGNAWRAGCVAGTFTITYSADHTTATLNCEINTDSLTDGASYYVRVHAGDNAGYGSPDSSPLSVRDFTVDRTAPTVAITSPNHQTVKGSTITITGSANDTADFSYYYCYVTLPGSSEVGTRGADCNTTWHSVTNGTLGTINVASLPDGNYEAHLVAYDKAGNHSDLNYAVPFTLDNTRPTLSFTAPADFSSPFPKGPIVSVHGSDTNGLSALVVHVYNASTNQLLSTPSCTATPAQLASGDLSCDLSGLAEGSYYIKAGENDTAGNNQTITSATFTIDKTAPVVHITAPSDGNTLHGVVTVSGTVQDTNPDHYYFVVKDSHGDVVAGPGTVNQPTVADWKWDTTKVADGPYTIDLEARDKAGNKDASSTQVITVTVSNTSLAAPTLLAPNDGTTTGKPVNFSWSPVAHADFYTFEFGDSGAFRAGFVTTDTYANDTLPQADEGTYLWHVNACTGDINQPQQATCGSWSPTWSFTIGSTTGASGNQSGQSTSDTLSFANTSSQVALTGPANNNGNTTGTDNAQTGNATNANGTILGESTSHSANGKVKGDSTVADKNASKKTGNFLVLGWWWLLAVAALALGWWFFAAYRRLGEEK